jgi:hypothetical protein
VGAPPIPAGRSSLDAGDRGAIAELREVLSAAGLTGEGVRAALGVGGEVLVRSPDGPVYERRLAGVEPLGPIIRLLVLEVPVRAAEAERAFAPLPLARLERMGVVEVSGSEVRPVVRIVPHDEILIASDRRVHPGADPSDHVAGVHGPSLTLSHLTVRRPVEKALDVGTGSGIQAILASRHSGVVLATDVNERALSFAAFNAILNGVDNVELRTGSFFEPVAGSRFGLITCNPPYVISPESAYLFRDSGLEGDSVSRDVVCAAPEHLEEGGFATMLVSWAHNPGEDWSAPLRAWVEGSGCDAWLLHYATEDPLSHAAQWNRDDPARLGETLDRWLAYFNRLGIEGIAYGAVVLRRRSAGANWVRADELSGERLRPAGGQILRVFDAGDFLSGLGDDRGLLGEAFALAERTRLEQRAVLRAGAWMLETVTLSLEEGLGFRASLDRATAELLAGLDGRRTLGEVVDELARRQGTTREALAGEAVAVVRGLLEAGFLVRGPSGGSSPQGPAA